MDPVWDDEILIEATESIPVNIQEDEPEAEEVPEEEQPATETPEEITEEPSEAEPQKPTFMTETAVAAYLKERRVKPVISKRLVRGFYENEAAIDEAVAEEVAYLKEVTQSGRPAGVGLGESDKPKVEKVNEKELQEKISAVNKKYFGG